jgi:hypothetical protein
MPLHRGLLAEPEEYSVEAIPIEDLLTLNGIEHRVCWAKAATRPFKGETPIITFASSVSDVSPPHPNYRCEQINWKPRDSGTT